jgi:hypothetical protein
MVAESECKIYVPLGANQSFHGYISTGKACTSVWWQTKILDLHAANTGQPYTGVTNKWWNAHLAIWLV